LVAFGSDAHWYERVGEFDKAMKLVEEAGIKEKYILNTSVDKIKAFLKSKKYNEAIEAYKNALRLNPKDEDTRYNLSYALRMAKKQDQQKQDQQQAQQQPQQGQPQEISKQDAERMLEAMKNAEQKTLEKLKKEKKAIVTEKPEKDW